MMTKASVEEGLLPRLERLAVLDPECCLPGFQELTQRVRKNPRFEVALERLRALADDKRLLALALLRRQPELCACQIQAGLGVTHATVSHHMAVLTRAGFVTSRHRGKWLYYRLNPKVRPEIP
jgi:ArsR family transcriptional regulator